MFYVNDTPEQRHQMISRFINNEEICIAVILATVDFEWTLRRAIIGLGKDANMSIRDEMRNSSGLDAYKKIWNNQVVQNLKIAEKYENKSMLNLSSIIPDWDKFKTKSYPLRHKITHGVQAHTGFDYGKEHCMTIMNATKAVLNFAKENGVDLYKRLPVRRIKKEQVS